MAAIVVGPYVVDASKCDHRPGHNDTHCVHDWRINGSGKNEYFGNVERTGGVEAEGV